MFPVEPWNPWESLATDFRHILLVTAHRLPRRIRGLFDGETIWLCSTLTPTESKCTLAHELIHAERGIAAQALLAEEELIVDAIAAERLIPLENLRHVAEVCPDKSKWASLLWVDNHTLNVRLSSLPSTLRADRNPKSTNAGDRALSRVKLPTTTGR